MANKPFDINNPHYRRNRLYQKIEERIVLVFLISAALLSIVTTVGILSILLNDSLSFFLNVGEWWRFFTDTVWDPPVFFGVLPLLNGTLLISLIATTIAFILGFTVAIYLSEYASPRVEKMVRPVLEVFGGIPTVVYGYFAITFLTPLLRSALGTDIVPQFNALSASIVMGFLIMPLVATLSTEAMQSVPNSLRNSAYALGATKIEVIFKIVVPAAISGIVASFILAFSRAIGETLIVTIAAGLRSNITVSPLEPVQTITAAIVRTIGGEAPRDSLEYYSIFAIGLALFIITFGLNIFGQWFVKRYRIKYE